MSLGLPMNDQIVELGGPGLFILVYSPGTLSELEEGGDYGTCFPDGRDLVDYVNDCRLGAVGVRFPARDYWLHFSAAMDHSVIVSATDHVLFGVEVTGQQLCVRGSDDLFCWDRACPGEQILSVEDGTYNVTACIVSQFEDGAFRIFMHFARVAARPELGYERVPELYCQAPI